MKTSETLREQISYWFNHTPHDMGKTEFDQLMEIIEKDRSQDRMREAMQEFVDRCEKGEIRSRYTYKKFKKILGNA